MEPQRKQSGCEEPLFSSFGLAQPQIDEIVSSTRRFAAEQDALKEDALSDDLELALHQDQSRLTMLWGSVLEFFSKEWIRMSLMSSFRAAI